MQGDKEDFQKALNRWRKAVDEEREARRAVIDHQLGRAKDEGEFNRALELLSQDVLPW